MIKIYLFVASLFLLNQTSLASDIVIEKDSISAVISEKSIRTIVFNKKNFIRTSISIVIDDNLKVKEGGVTIKGIGKHTVINCYDKTLYVIRLTPLDKDGNILAEYKSNKEKWVKPEPDSIDEKEIVAVCNYGTIEV